MKIGILGFGREGQAVLDFLKKDRRYDRGEIWILDKNKGIKIPGGVKSILGKDHLRHLSGFDLVFRSPGIPYLLPEIQKARSRGVKISSLTKLFFEEASKKGALIIGITGTKGKGTTSNLIYAVLKAARKDVHLAGNIGLPALSILPRLKKGSFVVLELSSFQLQDLHISPPVAVILDVFPDHMDSHKSLQEYYAAKGNISRFQKKDDLVFYAAANKTSSRLGKLGRGSKFPVDETTFSLFKPAELLMRGSHNMKNAAMAATVCLSLGIPKEVVKKAVTAFPGWEHRMEFVRKIGWVSFINDSASTNPHTIAAAARSAEPKILIAGGSDKNLDYKILSETLKKWPPQHIVLMGENQKKISQAVPRSMPLTFVNSLKEAVQTAYKEARKSGSMIDIILSPGAASFDMFKNYADRGEKFKETVKRIKIKG